jgi:hypothetical protein
MQLSIGGFSANLIIIDFEISLASMKGVTALLIPLTNFSSLNFSEFPLLLSTVNSDKGDDYSSTVFTFIMYYCLVYI